MANKSQREIEQGLEFGLTDDVARFDSASAYHRAAVEDGWKPETNNLNPVPPDCYYLVKDGFKLHIMTRRSPSSSWGYQASVNIWGPDRLTVKPPDVYDWEAIKAGLRTCNICGATDVETFQYSFAGRSCKSCLPEMKKKHEYPGWSN